jgi:hypothetical protein
VNERATGINYEFEISIYFISRIISQNYPIAKRLQKIIKVKIELQKRKEWKEKRRKEKRLKNKAVIKLRENLYIRIN